MDASIWESDTITRRVETNKYIWGLSKGKVDVFHISTKRLDAETLISTSAV